MNRPFAALCLLGLSALSAVAQEVDCANAITQMDLNICQQRDWEAADTRLNDVYADVIAVLRESDAAYPLDGPSEEDRLRNAQRAWIAFRDADCDAAGFPMRGGSAEPLLIYGCMSRMTEDRITELTLRIQQF